MLSAFLLTRIMTGQGRAAYTPQALAECGLRRVLRTYPLFGIYVGLALATSVATHFPLGQMKGVPLNMGSVTALRHLLLLDGKGVL